jgi:Ca-activated chloride channel family protein
MVFGTARAVKSHRTGRRRKKGGSRLPVAPWIVITLVCVLVASGLTWGFMTLLRTGCSSDVFRVTVAAAPSVFSSLEDAAQDWEATQPKVDGQCVGVEVAEVPAAEASRGITGVWDDKSWGKPPIAWVPDSQAWASWVSSSETSADYISTEPVVLGQAGAVLAVPESTATELGWLGGQPPTWADVLALTAEGTLRLAAANPRTSTEGLVSLLNATSDGAGGFAEDAKAAYSAAVESGSMTDEIGEQFTAHAEAPDATTVFTALDYQVESFNATSGLEDHLVPVIPSGATVGAVASYLVLGGATGWVSESDAGIAERFGEYLASADFADVDLEPVEDPEAALAQTTPEAVGQAVRSWQSDRQDLNMLFLIDRSAATDEEVVSYGGQDLTAGDATVSMAVGMVEDMESTYRAGLWEYGAGADGDTPWRPVTDIAEMSDGNREQLVNDLYDISDNEPYDGGSPLYDSLVAAYQYMNEHAADDAVNVVVVLTNSGDDTQSLPTVEETAASLASVAGTVKAYTVGFGEANADNLALLAEATGGAYIEAPAEGGVLSSIGG